MIAVLEGDHLVELHLEEMDNESITGNIFLGKVENFVSSLDASFIDIGKSKNAFLRNKDFIKGALGSKDARKNSVIPEKGKKDNCSGKKGSNRDQRFTGDNEHRSCGQISCVYAFFKKRGCIQENRERC
eukprot:TRINITY_DN23355_c0_g1_i1.p2 TRINITY_DN23355_c0_g1~~TRINITY_DN23355_c0_g1_i1.p2  ORF type:complete len:129 (-),score=2.64 TRINITY_DN23355_c0_g1_i1:358-744(-)